MGETLKISADYSSFSKKIKSLRIEKDILQIDIAKRLGISVNTYREYENNPENMKLSMINEIGNVLNENLLNIFLTYVDTKCIK